MKLQIRLADESDLAELARLFKDSVERIGPQRYTPEQVRAWAEGPDDRERFHAFILGVTTFVAEHDGQIAGFGGLGDDGHVASLYVLGDETRKGIGSALLNQVVSEAQARGISRLYTEASEFSRPLFEKFSFEIVEIERVERRGAWFDRYRMQRQL